MKKGILIQARLSSSRFPGKMLKNLGEIPLVHYVFNRCKVSSRADLVAVITSTENSDDPLYEYCRNYDIPVFRGDLENVLSRYIQAAKHFEVDLICRVCGDSPFVDIFYIDKILQGMVDGKWDYMSVKGSFNGFFSEAVSLKTLLKVQRLTNSYSDLEHVTKYIRKNLDMFNHKILDMKLMPEKLQKVTLTIDYEKDLELANLIIKNGLKGFDFTSQEVIKNLYPNNNDMHTIQNRVKTQSNHDDTKNT